MNKNIYTFLFTFFSIIVGLQAQNYIMDGSPINDCSGFFLDSGGGNAPYGPNENFTTTICPDLTTGTHIQLVFSGVNINGGDELCFFDGDNTGAPALACNTDFNPGDPFIIQATAVNTGGCLTVTFNSDGAGEGNGWSADINCIPACQTIIAEMVSTTPAIMPADTGWIDICPGEGIFFEGAGIYPQNGAVYNHSDFTSSFAWNFGDGVTSEGPTAYHVFDEPGGYIVQMTIVDQFGCRNTNYLSQRVRVSTYPDFELGVIPADICAGDTIQLAANINQIDSTYNVSVTPTTGTFQTAGVLSDSLALPDGVGVCYETSILFSDFAPGQILTNINDFVSICVVMEHSWMFDLDIFLTCPDGTQIILQDQEFLGEIYLGVPNDNDGANPIPGLGYQYCWTPTATNGTWTDYYNAFDPPTLPEGDYSPFESFDNFLGCPLNGEWTIEVCDQWGIDNGFIFEWSINFDPSLYPNIETFTPQIIDWTWNDNPSIFFTSANEDTIMAAPQNAGTASYNFYVTNDFGCTFDTVVNISVLPPTHPDCHTCEGELEALQDTAVCEGEILLLDGSVPIALGNQSVTFEAYANTVFDNNTFPPQAPLVSPIPISYINPLLITDASTQIESVCLSLTHGFDSDVELYLRAPNGAILELSTDNGGTGNNYTNTCFTPVAAQPITAGAPPYTGNFQPEGVWSVLNGSPVNGQWALLVADDQNGGAGTFLGWTITFNNENNITYTWDATPDLSCLDCPDPEVSPTQNSTYNLQAEDSFGCTFFDTVAVELLDALAAPVIDCNTLSLTEVEFTWSAIAGAGAYEVSFDGGTTWQPANGNLSHLVGGLIVGQTVDIWIRAVGGSGCEPLIAASSCTASNCIMSIAIANTIMPSCYNISDGTISLNAANGTAPINYSLDGSSAGGAMITGIPAGEHTIVATDADGCMDSITFIMPAPDSISIAMTIEPVPCNGGGNGAATATGSGGTGGFSYAWSTIPVTSGATLSNVPIGTYTVTVTDDNGCTNVSDAVIDEAEPIELLMSQFPALCNGDNTGSATVSATGGSGTYTYLWSNGQITATANNLFAGNYQVTVTDSENCDASANIDVSEAPAMTLNFNTTPVACFGTNTGSITPVLTGAVEPVTYIWSNGAGTATNNNITAGNYCLTISDANNCLISDCVDITETTELILTGNSTPTLCANGSEGTASVTANGGAAPYTYQWPDGQLTDMATGLMAGDYVVTVVDNNNCQETLMITVSAASAIDLQLAATATSCFNTDDGTATVVASGGMGNTFVYQWDVNAGSQTTAQATNLLPGDYCVTVIDNNNCTETECITVDAPPAVVVESITQNPTSCFNNTDGTATIVVSGGVGTTYTYLWDDPNGQTSNVATMLAAGIYIVTASDSNGCTVEASIEVTQPALLEATATGTDISCFGQTDGTASAAQTGGTAPYNYIWSNGQTTAIANSLAAGQQTVTITDNNGCTATAVTTLFEPASALGITVEQSFVGCFGENQSEAIVTATGGTANYTYLWSNGAQTAQANSLAANNYFVTVTDANGCTATELINISELPEVTFNVATVEPDCFGEASGQLGVNIVDGGLGGGDPNNYTYEWSGAGIPNLNTAYINSMYGGQDYTVTVSDAQGCSATATVFLDQPNQITFDLTTEDVVCNGEANGSISVVNIQSSNAPFSFQWSPNANGQTTQTVDNLSVGLYNITLTDAAGCTSNNSTTIAEPSPISLSFDIDNNLCSGTQAGAATVQAVGGVGAYSYSWSNGATNASIENLATGVLTITVTDGNECTETGEVVISQPTELTGLVQGDTVTCFGDQDGTVQMTALGGTAPYLYQFDDGALNATNYLVGVAAGTYPVLIQDANGCTWESDVSVGTPDSIIVWPGTNKTILLGDENQLPIILHAYPYYSDTSNMIGDYQVTWLAPYPGTLICPDSTTEDCETPIVNTQHTITYTAYVVDENGCEAWADLTITVKKNRDIFVPTAFTPNGDGVNNILLVHGKASTHIDVFRVYDRWGTLVYEARDFQANDGITGWDGSFKGKLLNPGTFVWYIEASYIDGYKETFKGQTTLLR